MAVKLMGRLPVFALCLLTLAACTVAFDRPITLQQPSEIGADLTGFWRLELDDAAAVVSIRPRSESGYEVSVFAVDKLITFDAALGELGGERMAVIDLSSLRDYTPSAGQVSRPYSRRGGFVVVRLQVTPQAILVQGVDFKRVKLDIASDVLAADKDRVCGPPAALPLSSEAKDANANFAFPFCILRLDQDQDLEAYFANRTDVLFERENAARLTRLGR